MCFPIPAFKVQDITDRAGIYVFLYTWRYLQNNNNIDISQNLVGTDIRYSLGKREMLFI